MLKQMGISLISASLLLAGCGGSDGGSSSSSVSYDGPTAAVAIDDTNADSIGGYASSQATSSELTDIVSEIPVGIASTTAADNIQPEKLSSLGQSAKKYVDMAMDSQGGPEMMAGATGSNQANCSGGGTLTTSYSYSDPVSAGDTATMNFNNCVEGTEKIDGSITFTLTSVTINQDQTLGDFSAAFTFSDLKSTDTGTGDYDWLNGSFTSGFSGDMSTTPLVITLSGSSLVLEEKSAGIIEQVKLTDFSFTDTLYTNWDFSFDHDYTLASTEIGGSITVETVDTFYKPYANNYPTSGQLIVTGASGAKIRVTAQADGTNVFVEYDIVPVDGIYEANATISWYNWIYL